MAKNTVKIIYKGKVISQASIEVDLPYRDVKDQQKGTGLYSVNEESNSLVQVKHELVNVGESIAQVKYNTTAKVTSNGLIAISQFKQEVASRDEEVWYYKNSVGTFVGTLAEAQEAFPDVNLSELNLNNKPKPHPELGDGPIILPQPVKWETLNEYDGEKQGDPTTWDKWINATQTALDIAGMVPAVGELADCLNGAISLARGNYADAALSFAAMIPGIGAAATVLKYADKVKDVTKKTEGVYDLIVKNGDDIQGYVGQSKDFFKRIQQHFNPKRGKLKHTILENNPIIHKMIGSTKEEREIYEQFIILKKYKANWKELGFLLNKVNPVGGKFDLLSPVGRKKFYEAAEKVADKYNLPKEFPDYLNQ